MDHGLRCPECGNADPHRMFGWDIRPLYDGVLLWQCADCSHMWPRFAEPDRLNAVARKWIAEQK